MLERIRNAEAGGINWSAVAAITGAIIAATVLVGALAALGVIRTGGTTPTTTEHTGGGSNEPPAGGTGSSGSGSTGSSVSGSAGSPGSGPGAQPGTVVLPATNVSLLANTDYALDGQPITPMPNDSCSGCIRVGDYPGEDLALQADNGVKAWTGSSPPTFAQCKKLLDTGPAKAVGIAIKGYVNAPDAVSPNGWLCARSKSGNYLALKFLGYTSGGGPYQFAVTGWKGTTVSPG